MFDIQYLYKIIIYAVHDISTSQSLETIITNIKSQISHSDKNFLHFLKFAVGSHNLMTSRVKEEDEKREDYFSAAKNIIIISDI